jgi:transposase
MTWRLLVAFREVRVNEIREVLCCWLAGDGLRTAAERAGVDRKTARRYVEAAQVAGLLRGGGEGQLSDELIGAVVAAVRPARQSGHGQSWDRLVAQEVQIRDWITDDLQLTNIHGKLARLGVHVPYRTLHRFAAERCGFGRRQRKVRVADGDPGVECQLDFARMGLVPDPEAGRRRVAHALIFTAVYSGHMFVWLTFRQSLDAVIAGCEAAWVFFGGIFKVLVPDNLSPVIADADPVNPRFTVGWLDYAQARGFHTDPARVRSPQDKPRVERVVQYVRGNFFAGEAFTDLANAQHRAEHWCTATAGVRLHGTTYQRPAEQFAAEEQLLLPAPQDRYDVPIFATPKVARDLHIEVARGLYSVPAELVGQRVDVRADTRLVKVFSRGQLVKTHPRVKPGGRSPIRRTIRSGVWSTRYATSPRSPPRPQPPGPRSASTRPGCWRSRCRGRGCGLSTGCSAWSAATGLGQSIRRACGRWSSTSSTWARSHGCSSRPSKVRRWRCR